MQAAVMTEGAGLAADVQHRQWIAQVETSLQDRDAEAVALKQSGELESALAMREPLYQAEAQLLAALAIVRRQLSRGG